jgi:hypothetical protein
MPKKSGPGSLAFNFHEGSRSEYLAQYVFSSFGTAVTVPHQEDTGLDIYCSLLEQEGRLAWPRAYYSVQVKSTMDPWVFNGRNSVRWFIEHPLPILLCIVQKAEARILVYHTTPRFSLWTMPELPERFEVILGTETQAVTGQWPWIGPCTLAAPILNFTIKDILDEDFRSEVKNVLQFWIDFDVENLVRIKNGIQQFKVPYDYETNKAKLTGMATQGNWRFREDTFPLAKDRLTELLWLVATHSDYTEDMVSAVVYAMALRQLQPSEHGLGTHPSTLHNKLNDLFGFEAGKPGNYTFKACDLLLQMVKDELARRPARSGRAFRLGETVRSLTGRLLINTIDNNATLTDRWAPRGVGPIAGRLDNAGQNWAAYVRRV